MATTQRVRRKLNPRFARKLLQLSDVDLFRIHRTLAELLHDNGYAVPPLLAETTQGCDGKSFHDRYIPQRQQERVAAAEARAQRDKKRRQGRRRKQKTQADRGDDEDADAQDSAQSDHDDEDDAEDSEREDPDLDGDESMQDAGAESKECIQQPPLPDDDDSHFEPVLTFCVPKRDQPEGRLLVLFSRRPQLGFKAVQELKLLVQHHHCSAAILVVQSGITPMAKTPLENLAQQLPCYIRTFLHEQLLFNLTKHTLVPRHRAATAAETQELMRKYKLKTAADLFCFGKLFVTDPVAYYYGWQPGTLVLIDHIGQPVCPRIVVERPPE